MNLPNSPMVETHTASRDNTATVSAPNRIALPVFPIFDCTLEVQDLVTFQREGHFVPAMRDVVQQPGTDTVMQQPRPWRGNQVYIVQLHFHNVQMLRVLADSQEEATRMMGDAIRSSFFGMFTAQHTIDGLMETLRVMQDERNATMSAAREKGLPEGIHDPVGAVKWLRRPLWRRK